MAGRIRVVLAEGLDRLLDALAHDLAEARATLGPLVALRVVTEGPANRAFVEQGLARRLGIAAHLRFGGLGRLFAELLAEAAPGATLVGVGAWEIALFDAIRSSEAAEVRRYVASGAGSPALDESKALDLARALARAFDTYGRHRPDWVGRWRRREPAPNDADPGHWGWHGELLRAVAGPGGPFDPERSPWWLPLDALERVESWRGSHPVFLFDAPPRASVEAAWLERVAGARPVHLYLVNPSAHFWEDIDRRDPSLLGRWGQAGRAALAMASALAHHDVEQRAAPLSPATTVLEALTRSVRQLEPDGERRAADASLRIVAATDLRAECDEIVAEIRARLAADDSLRLTDFLVALAGTEQDRYRTALEVAFAEARIPAHGISVPVAADSSLFDGVRRLLKLPCSAYTRRDVLRVLTHPATRARFGLGSADEWGPWCDRLGVVHGADHSDHEGTYIERDLFHWDQGARRLALGACVAGESAGREEPVEIGGALLVPVDFTAEERGSAARLLALSRSLIADARAIASARHSLGDWAERLRIFVDTYLSPPGDAEDRDLELVHAALDEIAGLPSAELGYGEAARLFENRLDRPRRSRGAPLAEGVVLAPLADVASLPFRVVFLPGLAERAFPASDGPAALDLRQGRRAEEPSPRDEDRYRLLLRLLATGDAVRLSYVGRDPYSGDPKNRSTALVELEDVLRRDHLEPGACLSETSPPRPVTGTRALRESLAAVLPTGAPLPDLAHLEQHLPRATWEALSARIGLPRLPPPRGPRRPRVRLGDLRAFLEDPFVGWARHALSLAGSPTEDPLTRVDEPFEPTGLETSSVLRQVFLAAAGGDLEARYLAEAERLELTGRLPTGVFGEAARARHLGILEAWQDAWLEALEGLPAPLARLGLGTADPGSTTRCLPPLELESVTLRGHGEPILDSGGSFCLVATELKGERDRVRVDLGAWLTQLAAAASGLSAERWPAFVADPVRLHRGALSPVSAEEAKAELDALCLDLHRGGHRHLLPLPVQLGLLDAKNQGHGKRRLEAVLERARPSPFAPLPAPLPPPPLEEALELAERRLGRFLRAREAR